MASAADIKAKALPNPADLPSQAQRSAPANFRFENLTETPAYVVDEGLLDGNCRYLGDLAEACACKILLAQKAYSFYDTYPLIGQYLAGTAASGLYEAKLGYEEMPGTEVHVYSPAFQSSEISELAGIADKVIFNSLAQYERFAAELRHEAEALGRALSFGLRVNPEYSEVETDLYNPAGPFSRLGMTAAELRKYAPERLPEGISGLHFHTLCEENASSLVNTFAAFETKFAPWLKGLSWLNLGGGHHLTRDNYEVDKLVDLCHRIRKDYGVDLYLEPGEAIALDTGYLVADVIDLISNVKEIAILNTSATCHMPDVLEMPYRPRVFAANAEGEFILAAEEGTYPYNYRLAGPTCLAGDVIGDFSFPQKLELGSRLVFCDMAIYTQVKTHSFNGMPLPSLFLRRKDGQFELLRRFGYVDFKMRLGRVK